MQLEEANRRLASLAALNSSMGGPVGHPGQGGYNAHTLNMSASSQVYFLNGFIVKTCLTDVMVKTYQYGFSLFFQFCFLLWLF